MNSEEQELLEEVATLCGWTRALECGEGVPRYTASRDFVVSAEEKLLTTEELRADFIENLKSECKAHRPTYRDVERLLRATAAERCRALVKTLKEHHS